MIDLAAVCALWCVTYLLHSTVLYGIAWLIDHGKLLRAPVAREYIWRAAMVGALLTATAQSAGLVRRVPLATFVGTPRTVATGAATAEPTMRSPAIAAGPETGVNGVTRHAATSAIAPTALAPAVDTITADPNAPPAVGTARVAFDRWSAELAGHWTIGLALLWLAGASVAVLRLFVLRRRAHRELADRAPAGASLVAELAALCSAQGVKPPTLSVAPALAGPISLPAREIVVPPWAIAALDARQRRAMLAHELAHQVRRDPQWLTFALGLDALLWLQPLNRLARRRLSHLAELEADAWAARAVDDPRSLAECLVECAEHLQHNRAALFGAAMGGDSPLVERVDRLVKGIQMHSHKAMWAIRAGAGATLLVALFLLPGCDIKHHISFGSRSSTRISISNGGATVVTADRPGYALEMKLNGKLTFAEDESDIATLGPNGNFELTEQLDGVKRTYAVKADHAGALTRAYSMDDQILPLDAAARQWLAEALPRMFRESGFDAEARLTRLLARGGPALVLAEVDRISGDHAKGAYLGMLLGRVKLEAADLERAFASAAKIGSDFELGGALSRVVQTQDLDAARFSGLMQAAGRMGSDFELSKLLAEAISRVPDDTAARAAWIAAAAKLGSDFELRRAIEAALDERGGAAGFAEALVTLAKDQVDSDFELRTVLEKVAPRTTDPAVATAYLAAARRLGSDFERRNVLLALFDKAQLDAANLQGALDATAELGSDFEKRAVLVALASRVAGDPALSQRFRDVARPMSDYDRGEALRALDDAARPAQM